METLSNLFTVSETGEYQRHLSARTCNLSLISDFDEARRSVEHFGEDKFSLISCLVEPRIQSLPVGIVWFPLLTVNQLKFYGYLSC